MATDEKQEENGSIVESFPSLTEVEEIIGYRFNNQELLQQAFTHYEKCWSSSYERIEYVGDSVLNLLIAREDYFTYPDLPPGKLTRLRSANVDTEKLARVAVKHNLHKYLRHKKPMLDRQVSYNILFFILVFNLIGRFSLVYKTHLIIQCKLKAGFIKI